MGDSSLAAVEFSLEGPLNHEVPDENKPAEGTKQRKRKEQGRSGEQSDRENSAKELSQE